MTVLAVLYLVLILLYVGGIVSAGREVPNPIAAIGALALIVGVLIAVMVLV